MGVDPEPRPLPVSAVVASRPRALIFDVDGTLYRQAPLRRRMALRLFGETMLSPAAGFEAIRAIRAYRRAQESLRHRPGGDRDVAAAQLHLAARSCGIAAERVRGHVERWMDREPLALLPSCAMSGVARTLDIAHQLGIRLAVLSDYPATEKLQALGILGAFEVVVTAQDPHVQRFKPDPRGLQVTIERLAVAREDVVYVGDRADVDGLAARRAGVRYVIVNQQPRMGRTSRPGTSSYDELATALLASVEESRAS